MYFGSISDDFFFGKKRVSCSESIKTHSDLHSDLNIFEIRFKIFLVPFGCHFGKLFLTLDYGLHILWVGVWGQKIKVVQNVLKHILVLEFSKSNKILKIGNFL